MLVGIPDILAESDRDENVKFVVFTGEGDYFTSGNDATNFLQNTDTLVILYHLKESHPGFFEALKI